MLTDVEIAKAIGEIYNEFWVKCRKRKLVRHSDDWERIHSLASVLIKKYPFKLAEDMVKDLLDVLESRVEEAEKNGS